MPELQEYDQNKVKAFNAVFTEEWFKTLEKNNPKRLKLILEYADNAKLLSKLIDPDKLQQMLQDDPNRLICLLTYYPALQHLIKQGDLSIQPFLAMKEDVLERFLENKTRYNAINPRPPALDKYLRKPSNLLPALYVLKLNHTTNERRKKIYTAWTASASVIAVAGTAAGLTSLLIPLLSTLVLGAIASPALIALGAVLLVATLVGTALCANHAHQCTPKRLKVRFIEVQNKLTRALDDADPEVDNSP